MQEGSYTGYTTKFSHKKLHTFLYTFLYIKIKKACLLLHTFCREGEMV
jgi:hypothetical protein